MRTAFDDAASPHDRSLGRRRHSAGEGHGASSSPLHAFLQFALTAHLSWMSSIVFPLFPLWSPRLICHCRLFAVQGTDTPANPTPLFRLAFSSQASGPSRWTLPTFTLRLQAPFSVGGAARVHTHVR